jgi:hypothetical protein
VGVLAVLATWNIRSKTSKSWAPLPKQFHVFHGEREKKGKSGLAGMSSFILSNPSSIVLGASMPTIFK